MRKHPKWPLKPNEREVLLDEHNFTCHRCRGPIDPVRDRWHVGHVIDRACGGSDEWTNLRPEHSRCNLAYAAEVGNTLAAKIKRVRHRHRGGGEPTAWSKAYHATKAWLKAKREGE
jgi:5-methylcytosine-specific restriction endonuclease McrA